MPLKTNIPVKSFCTPLAYYCFNIEREGTYQFQHVSGKIEAHQFVLGVEPEKDFMTITQSDSLIQCSAGDLLWVIVKGYNYKFVVREYNELQDGVNSILPNIPYHIAPDDCNLKLHVKGSHVLTLTQGQYSEVLELDDSELILACNEPVTLNFESSNKRVNLQCQRFY
tara:strand:- start:250 stop:753 length:504 start_codon:yes stop_codon:yes gene_type:complete